MYTLETGDFISFSGDSEFRRERFHDFVARSGKLREEEGHVGGLNDTGAIYHGHLDNLSANGFAFLTPDTIFAKSKGKDIRIEIEDFDLRTHNVLEGRIIRCSNNDGMYIVGCQMAEDDYLIMNYVEKNLSEE